jgi:hypothetical protein
MAIEFLKADPNKQFVRPKNGIFPTGLTQTGAARTTIDYLVVAGGGGGGSSDSANYSGGGGGAGGLIQGSNFSVTNLPLI